MPNIRERNTNTVRNLLKIREIGFFDDFFRGPIPPPPPLRPET